MLPSFKIWVDADACPKPIKEILFRAAERVRVELILVANQPIYTPNSKYIKAVQVASGFDVADDKIVQAMEAGDLVVTADIPLASEIINNGGYALSPRGELYTEQTIKQRLSMRNFLDELRSSGVNTGGPSTLSLTDRQSFANALDRWLASRTV